MLFNSLEFIYVFLPITIGIFYFLSKYRLIYSCKITLLIASLAFYGYWKLSYFFLIIVSILANYLIALAIQRYRYKSLLTLGVIFNLGILCYFKYLTFVIDNLQHIFPLSPFTVNIIIPLGISFYTFQQIAYLVDLHQGKTRIFNLFDYALFVTFFPQLIAGPIVHYTEMMPQFNRIKTYLISYKNLFHGIFFFLVGLFQKVVIADFLNPIADMGFVNAQLLSFIEAWGVVIAYSLQIYFDFSGYSNMAIGLALLFNIKIPLNFNSPYQACSIIDFWRRWHMTLSRFLRDYVYIPLGGNRKGNLRRYSNIFITMVIGGFWHGAGWTFVVWGAYHGILIVINHLLREIKIGLPKLVKHIITFFLVTYGWVFFKAENFSQSILMTKSLFSFNNFQLSGTYFIWKHQFILIGLILILALFLPNAQYWSKKIKPTFKWGVVFFTFFVLNILYLNRESAFLYFQF